jgi:RimJ/RimL family protein N-acetyltransferase
MSMNFELTHPIETRRLKLRPFTRGDVDAVYAYRSREDVARYLTDGPMSREQVAEAVQMRTSFTSFRGEETDKIYLAVERTSDHTMMGEVVLILRSQVSRQAELGYIINPEFHHQGYASEAGEALLQLGFDVISLHRIFARCHAHNEASARVMRRLGMRQEAHFREHNLNKGRWEEELIYAILEDEWRARKPPQF